MMNGMISIASGSQVFARNEEKTIINQTVGLLIIHLINIPYSVWAKKITLLAFVFIYHKLHSKLNNYPIQTKF